MERLNQHLGHRLEYSEQGWRTWEIIWEDGDMRLYGVVEFSRTDVDDRLYCKTCDVNIDEYPDI